MPNILIETDPFLDGEIQHPTFDGTENNLNNTDWGSAGAELLNQAPLDYSDSISAPSGQDRPAPREISNTMANQEGPVVSEAGLSNMVWAMGQFLDHDLSLTPALSRADALAAGETLDIEIPDDDPYMNPDGVDGLSINFQRSGAIDGTGNSADNPRQLPNIITSWIDGSNIYGSDDERADSCIPCYSFYR